MTRWPAISVVPPSAVVRHDLYASACGSQCPLLVMVTQTAEQERARMQRIPADGCPLVTSRWLLWLLCGGVGGCNLMILISTRMRLCVLLVLLRVEVHVSSIPLLSLAFCNLITVRIRRSCLFGDRLAILHGLPSKVSALSGAAPRFNALLCTGVELAIGPAFFSSSGVATASSNEPLPAAMAHILPLLIKEK